MSDKYCILQDDLKDCGVCSLLSVIKYFGGNVSKEYLRELSKTSKDGVKAVNLLRSARELGFEAYGVKASLNDIENEYLPIIAHVTVDKKFNHFVVIYKICVKKNEVLVMDPAKGYVKMTFSNFMNISTGYFLVLKKKSVIPNLIENSNFFDNVKSVIKKYKIVYFIIFVISLIFTIINIISSYNFKLLFDESGILKTDELLFIFIILALLSLFKVIANLFRNLLINKVNFILDKSVISNAFNHIINLPYLYYKNHTNGDLLTRINDLGNIKELISNFFVSLFVDLILAIIILIVMFGLNSLLTLITIMYLVLYSFVAILSNKVLKGNIRESYEKISLVNNYLVESLTSFETIKNLSLQNYIGKKFNKKYEDYNLVRESLIKKINYGNFFKESILSIGNIVILYLGVLYLKGNSLQLTSLITFITLSSYLIEPIKNILNLGVIYQNTKESIRRIKEIYCIPQEQLRFNTKTNIRHLPGRIDVNNVSYSYNGVDKVVNNISFEIKEGNKVLICGDSGSGKSTLMKILIKYLDSNYNGNIIVDGYDLKNIDVFSLRNNICYVSQNEYLYSDTIYDNITLGKHIEYKKFLKICENLFINDIVKKSSLGYNYLIENNGENLSGGERMRIIIARSLLKYSNIYIYDETFSSLDVLKEREILKYIFDLNKNKTIIVISHRRSNLDLFDQQINLGGGCEESVW